MNEEQFNADLRKFLKTFGVTAQREIEKAVWKGLEEGTIQDGSTLRARAKLDVDGVDVDVVIEQELRLG